MTPAMADLDATTSSDSLRARRVAVVREHMESENEHDFDTTIGTFSHPRTIAGAMLKGRGTERGQTRT